MVEFAMWSIEYNAMSQEYDIPLQFFVLGPRNGKVETPPKLVDSQHPPLYVPFHFEEYCALRTLLNSYRVKFLIYFVKKLT